LTAKVRHNDVRLKLPFTFKFLDHLELSIGLFADYAKQAATLRRQGRNTPGQKLASLVGFLGNWLDLEDRAQATLWDLACHENALVESATHEHPGARESESESELPGRMSMESKPVHRTRLILQTLSCNPVSVVKMLGSGRADIAGMQRDPIHLVYAWDHHKRRVNVLQLDQLGFIILELVDGTRSVLQLVDMLAAAGVALDGETLGRALQVLADWRLIRLSHDTCVCD